MAVGGDAWQYGTVHQSGDLAWVWPGSGLDLAWVWPGSELDLAWVWPGSGLDSQVSRSRVSG